MYVPADVPLGEDDRGKADAAKGSTLFRHLAAPDNPLHLYLWGEV